MTHAPTPLAASKKLYSADLIELFAEVAHDAMNALSRVVFENKDIPWASLSTAERQKYIDAAAISLWFCPSENRLSGRGVEPCADILSLWFGVDHDESVGEFIHGPGEDPARRAQVALIEAFMDTIGTTYTVMHESERLRVSLLPPQAGKPHLKSV
jgi:hypothetical protein